MTLSCGMLHPEITTLHHYWVFNGISGKFYRSWIYYFAMILVGDKDSVLLIQAAPGKTGTLLSIFFYLLFGLFFPPKRLPMSAGMIISRLTSLVACPTCSLCCSTWLCEDRLLGIAFQLIFFVGGQCLSMPTPSWVLTGPLCLCHSMNLAKNKPTSGRANFVAHFTNRTDRQGDCRVPSVNSVILQTLMFKVLLSLCFVLIFANIFGSLPVFWVW